MQNGVIRDLLRLDDFDARTVFDVGANVGQSAVEMAAQFPRASIFSFEPIAAAYMQLCSVIKYHSNVQAFRLALSSEAGEARMRSVGASLANRMLTTASVEPDAPIEMAPTVTGDAFCRERNIDRIDFLKIDTEGHDVEVLKGFYRMLYERRIEYVQVECGFADSDRLQPFERFVTVFKEVGYQLFGVYDQERRCRNVRSRNLRYANAVFVSSPAEVR